MSSSDFLPRSAAPLTATSESSPARYSPPAVLQALPPATPSTATHTHEPPPIASSSKAVVGAPPKEVMGEFGVLSRSSTASTSNTGSGRGGGPGMAGVGAHKKEDSLGFVFNPEAMLVSPTLAIPASAPRGSLDDPETASGYGTSMYASEMLSPLSRSDSAEAGKPPSLHTLGGISEEGVVMTATRAVATPPKPLSFSAVSTAASSVVDSPAPPPPIASPPAVGVAMPRVRVQRPSGPRQSSASSMSWSGHGNDPPLS
ncbi:hypothetical protein DL96DRAFT_1630648 [Flagelloscypha sp. PMI_526]|nr:hypothetical protein DL96DRAFT_1630648 [Flagelloscypha sp. PMI_526]